MRKLKDNLFFSNRDEDILSSLVKIIRPVFFAPEDIVILEGHIGHEMYVIAEGYVLVFSKLINGTCNNFLHILIIMNNIDGKIKIVVIYLTFME